jgi:hypothetical protein
MPKEFSAEMKKGFEVLANTGKYELRRVFDDWLGMIVFALSLYGVYGEIAHMNSLSLEFFRSYKLQPPLAGGLYIIENKEDSAFFQRSNQAVQDSERQLDPIIETVKEVLQLETKIQDPVGITQLF